MENEFTFKKGKKLKIDNAGMIYPNACTKDWKAMYNISVYLKKNINPESLQNALTFVIKRFPTFNMQIKKSYGWFYFQELSNPILIEKETDYPCQNISLKKESPLIKILYIKNKIALEVFHSIADGYGAQMFLNSLVAKYLNLQEKIKLPEFIENFFNEKPKAKEIEDSFFRYANTKLKNKRKEKIAYHFKGTQEEYGKLNVVSYLISLKDMKKYCNETEMSLTEFILLNYFKSLISNKTDKLQNHKPVKISLPVNLRNMLPSHSLRNFSSYLNLEIDSHIKSDFDILISIRKQLLNLNKEYFLGNIQPNVNAEKSLFIKIIPLFIKKIILNWFFEKYGEALYSTVFSNLGRVTMPSEFNDYIENYECFLGNTKTNIVNLCAITFNDTLCLTFSSKTKEEDIQTEFLNNLKNCGINVKIRKNTGGAVEEEKSYTYQLENPVITPI